MDTPKLGVSIFSSRPLAPLAPRPLASHVIRNDFFLDQIILEGNTRGQDGDPLCIVHNVARWVRNERFLEDLSPNPPNARTNADQSDIFFIMVAISQLVHAKRR